MPAPAPGADRCPFAPCAAEVPVRACVRARVSCVCVHSRAFACAGRTRTNRGRIVRAETDTPTRVQELASDAAAARRGAAGALAAEFGSVREYCARFEPLLLQEAKAVRPAAAMLLCGSAGSQQSHVSERE
jgi:hypothetical protein